MTENTILLALADVIEKHLPTTKRATLRGSAYKQQSQEYASGLITTLLTNAEVFGASHDIEALDDLYRSLVNTMTQLNRISFPARQSINNARLIETHFGDAVLTESFRVSVENMTEAVNIARSERRKLKPASAKRNWEAAAIAGACRAIWGAKIFSQSLTIRMSYYFIVINYRPKLEAYRQKGGNDYSRNAPSSPKW
ncbi:MAG: hypothetical protein ACSHWZ_03880 [Sulfitobacter sp.]